MRHLLKVHPSDNVIVALTDLSKGQTLTYEGETYILQDNIQQKHKFVTEDLNTGDPVIMYGVLVGKAMHPIPKGGLIHTQNLKHAAADYSGKQKDYTWTPPDVSKWKDRTFMGYLRSDGRVGTANYWLFVPTVFCENRNLEVIKEALNKELGYGQSEKYKNYTRQLISMYESGQSPDTMLSADLSLQEEMFHTKRLFPNIDGIKFLTHQGGCGGTRQDSAVLSKLLASYADHPNVAGVTVLSLGCQHLQMDDFKQEIFQRNSKFDKPLLMFEQQKSQSEESLISEAIKQTFVHLVKANTQQRQPAPLSKMVLGVKCGGSDGFSGISANPAVGYAADLLVGLGGTVLLAEFPELCGVEQELADRCINNEIAAKFVHLMKSYNAQAESVGSGFHANPSPGNIRDGLITDAIKSAGAAKKGGTAPIVDVLDYTEPATKPGLNLVCTPGNDVEATTGKTASGSTLILFTTGLGTPTGNPVCPVIKVATNSDLARRMADIIDIDTGDIITGQTTIEQKGEEILEYCIRAASGLEKIKSVELGQDDFIPWKRGVSL
ncbi:altronate dehydratase family protein [Cytophagaceae bacterium YF14B1]|uniref:Altronate dehydratase family protein n=1 Tax=Xanthocytophaga flava TaxID=3048013 RepID=A0AAE3QHQ6_9BACT|nr:altronate dehydratase family protein [Xanthocytophaga flavus]MDJ1479040.1 altronate dehydratase family protein [Xanthocytophaga flavus]